MKFQNIWRASKLEANADQSVALATSLEALELSDRPALDSKPCTLTSANMVDSDEYARDSGYGSATSTLNPKNTTTPLRSSTQIPLIQQTGLHVSNKLMEPKTKRRFLEVQLEIERMLLEIIRKLKSSPGMYKPIAIRPMMLGRTGSDAEAESYMVVICSEDIKRKIHDFFGDPLVKSLCDPDDEDVPSFKTLVIGHAIRLRSSSLDISVHCRSTQGFPDGTTTFCGMPIHLCDEQGHTRNATFGGMVKVTSTDGDYQLYGLTAGHTIRGGRFTVDDDEEDIMMHVLNGSNTPEMDLSDEVMKASNIQSRTGPPTCSNGHDQVGPGSRYSLHHKPVGRVLDPGRGQPMSNASGEQSQMRPHLDWALFEINSHRPNQLGPNVCGIPQGDLHLPFSIVDPRNHGIPVSMLCASEGVKHGVLSSTSARILLHPWDSFTDAYTLALQGSKISDGDSGSWVVDEPRLEVYGHVVADDVFGDAYVIPMKDLLADIQRCFDAESVNLPSALDIIPMASLQQLEIFAATTPKDRSYAQVAVGNPEPKSTTKTPTNASPLLSGVDNWLLDVCPTDHLQSSETYLEPNHFAKPHSDLSVYCRQPAADMIDPGQMSRSIHSPSLNPPTIEVLRCKANDSGYSSLRGTPNNSVSSYSNWNPTRNMSEYGHSNLEQAPNASSKPLVSPLRRRIRKALMV